MTAGAPRRALVVGCGFVGLRVARRLRAEGWEVTGITGSAGSAEALAGEPFPVFARDVADPSSLEAWRDRIDAAVHCASSGGGGEEAYRRVYLAGAENLLRAVRPRRLVFAGSTSVYGQTGGEWVDEASAAEPARETGRILLAAERAVLEAGGAVIRLAGLYGPGRWALLRKFLEGSAAIEGDGGRWINQIHRDDAAGALCLAAGSGFPPGLYNAADDHPVTQREAYGEFARRWGRPLPPAGPRDAGKKRGWTSKRVANGKLRAAGWCPAYPSYLAALDAGIDPGEGDFGVAGRGAGGDVPAR